MNTWFNQKIGGNGGHNRKPQRFKDLGDYSIDTLVRELIQNSLDAKLHDQPYVKLKISVTEINKAQFEKITDFIGQDQIALFQRSFDMAVEDVKVRMAEGNLLFKKDISKEYTLLIEEYNTIGLTGSVLGVDDKSNFDSLMRKTDNNEAKSETGISGGTWGKGSSIFTFTSKLWTWFAYSTLSKPWHDLENKITHDRRFMGRCMIAPFFERTENIAYTGDGWFSEKKYGDEPYPFINETADKLAQNLGLAKREDTPGTTFFIPFFNPYLDNASLDAIKKEFHSRILQNWFIPIFKGVLTVILKIGDEELIINKNLVLNTPELKFKNEILEWYFLGVPKRKNFFLEEIEVEVPPLQKGYLNDKNAFASKKKKVKLDLAIRLLDEDEDYQDNWVSCNKVFLTRNQGMLISYYEPFPPQEIRFESILFAGVQSKTETDILKAKHLDLFLAYSENPAHNKWCDSLKDYNICFLDRFEGKSPKPETYIKRMFQEIYNSLKKLVIKEKKANTSKDICSIFKKLTKLKDTGDGASGKSLFFMRTPNGISNPYIDEQGRYTYTYKLISNLDDEDLEISFKSYISSLEGEKDTDFESLGVPEFADLELLNENNAVLTQSAEPLIFLNPLAEKIIKIRTCVISNKRSFKNLQPLIKTKAKKIIR